MSLIDKYYQIERYKVNSKDNMENLSRRKIAVFDRVLKDKKFNRVLDAGCGDGRLAKLVKDRWGAEVYGVDVSRKGVELARGFGIKAKVADISKKIPFANNFFDLVICTETIEHVADPDSLLKEIHRILKPDGTLLLTTPNLSSWTNRFLFVFGIYPIFMEASTEAKVGYGIFSRFFNSQFLVGHIHVFNLIALTDILKFHHYSIEKIVGNRVPFVAPSSKIVTAIYNFIDTIMVRFPSLSSDLIIVART